MQVLQVIRLEPIVNVQKRNVFRWFLAQLIQANIPCRTGPEILAIPQHNTTITQGPSTLQKTVE